MRFVFQGNINISELFVHNILVSIVFIVHVQLANVLKDKMLYFLALDRL